MYAEVVSKCEVRMTDEEVKRLSDFISWAQSICCSDEFDNFPEGVQEIMETLMEEAETLYELIPEEH